jgi:hypothetical protein
VAESQHRLKIRALTISGTGAHSVFFSACQIDIDARLSPSQPGEPPVAKPRHGRPRAGFFLALTRHFYGPSVLCRRHSTRRSHRSWRVLPRFGHGMGMRLGLGQATGLWRSTWGIMANVVNDFLLFSCWAAFVTGIVLAAASLLI